MPRKIRPLKREVTPLNIDLVERLVEELKGGRLAGQPLIDEARFPESGAIRSVVIWDRWSGLKDDERTQVILEAYERAEGSDFRAKIAIAVGLTVPEAVDAGYLPFKVVLHLRSDDPVTDAECRQAMIEEGASVVGRSIKPQLRFLTVEDAEAGRDRLIQRLPKSDKVWIITQEISEIVD